MIHCYRLNNPTVYVSVPLLLILYIGTFTVEAFLSFTLLKRKTRHCKLLLILFNGKKDLQENTVIPIVHTERT